MERKTTLRVLALGGLLAFAVSSDAQGKWVNVGTGAGSTYAVASDGTLWGWGWNEKSQLGLEGYTSDRTSTPMQIGTDADWECVASNSGQTYSFFIKKNGTLWAAGSNTDGVQGTSSGSDNKTLTQVGTDTDWKAVCATRFYGTSAYALKTDGTAYAWGNNEASQLGTGTTDNANAPVQIGTDADWAQLSAGNMHVLALKKDGTIWGWGWNANRQITGTETKYSTPVQIGTDKDWVYVFAVAQSSYAIKSDGTLWAWGDNDVPVDEAAGSRIDDPTKVTAITGKVVFISGCKDTRVVGIGEGNVAHKVMAWGSNADGALGDGNGIAYGETGVPTATTPVTVDLPEGLDIVQLVSGEHYSIVRTGDGRLYGWGSNRGGQLADGTKIESLPSSFYTRPVEVAPEEKAEDPDTYTFDAENIPDNLNSARKIILTGTWGTSDFQKLTNKLGNNAGFPPAGNTSLEEVDMSGITLQPSTSLYVEVGFDSKGVFNLCKAIKTIKMPALEERSNIATLTSAFNACSSLEELDLKGFSGLKNIYGMASACSALKRVDLTGCTSITNSREAFLDCTALEEVILPGTMTLSSRIFRNCTALRKIDFTAWSGDEAPSLPGDAFDGISDLKAVSVYVAEDKYDLFANDSEWQKFTLVKVSSTGIASPVVEEGTSSRTVYSVNGSVVKTLKAGEGINSLPEGIYIINKKKYQVK